MVDEVAREPPKEWTVGEVAFSPVHGVVGKVVKVSDTVGECPDSVALVDLFRAPGPLDKVLVLSTGDKLLAKSCIAGTLAMLVMHEASVEAIGKIVGALVQLGHEEKLGRAATACIVRGVLQRQAAMLGG